MLKIGVVGCGRIAKKHISLLADRNIKDAELVAVCDIVKEKAKQYSIKYNLSYYNDMHKMMEKEDIDIISVLTESGNHAKHVIELSKYGKHIIVEKPMALTIDDADSMIEACDKNNCRLFVIKQNRFNLPIIKLKEAIDEGRFGKIFLGTVRVRWSREQSYYDQAQWRGTWSMDGGVMANQASHHIDLLQWLLGKVDSAYSKGIQALVNIETEDTAVAILKFRNGALGTIEATTAARPRDIEASISILGEKGAVEIGGFAVNKIKYWEFVDKDERDKNIEKYSENPPNVYGFGHKAYYEHVISSISSNNSFLVDGLEGKKTVEILSAIYESMETKQEIYLRFKPEKCKLGQRL